MSVYPHHNTNEKMHECTESDLVDAMEAGEVKYFGYYSSYWVGNKEGGSSDQVRGTRRRRYEDNLFL